MKQLLNSLVLLILIPGFNQVLIAQNGCGTGRYITEIFSDLDETKDVQFGSNTELRGGTKTLLQDIYEPRGDVQALRPLVVLAHGGSFVGGDKDQGDVVDIIRPLSRMGYVCSSMQYRLGMNGLPWPGPDSTDAAESVFRGVHDMKACVRWWYKSARTGNPYRIDTNHIYIGGSSAGAIVALHMAYVDNLSELPGYIDTTQAGLGGGVEGNSGNPGYPSRVAGIVNVSGAIADTVWMDVNDVPVVSTHGTSDDVVPHDHSMLSVFQIFQIFKVHGSESVHHAADRLGMNHCYYPYPGEGHVPHTLGTNTAVYLDSTINIIKHFLVGLVCGTGGSCGYISTSQISSEVAGGPVISPNPAIGDFRVILPESWGGEASVELWDLKGNLIRRVDRRSGNAIHIARNGLAAGLYFVRIKAGGEYLTRRVVLE